MIDLSHRITSGMTVFPGDPDVHLAPALTVERDGVAGAKVGMGSHTGTHLDAPSHTVAGGRTLEGITLDELCGEALVIRVTGAREGQALDERDLGLEQFDRVPRIVAVHTGWDRHFGTPQYLRHPFLTRGAAEGLCARGMHLLAVDVLNPDRTPDGQEDVEFEVHEVVLGSDRLIVENVRGLDLVPDRVRLGFFPLKLGAVDGAPIRAVAFTGDDVAG